MQSITLRKYLSYALGVGFILTSFLIFGSSAKALDPGCYEYLQGEAIGAKIACPAGFNADSCYEKSETGNEFFVIDCSTTATPGVTAQPVGAPTPTTGSGSNADLKKLECEKEVLTAEDCGIVALLINGINFLSAVAGLAIAGSIIYSGYQYMTARDNSGQIEAAKKRIMWALIALVLFIFMYAILNFLVPGGVL